MAMLDERQLLRLLHELVAHRDAPPTLEAFAARAGWSAWHLHRAFREVAGETPKQYGLRLQLEAAAALLATSDLAVGEVARRTGFRSPEVFTRAFGRTFGRSPSAWRELARARPTSDPAHTLRIGPCVRLFHFPVDRAPRRPAVPVPEVTRVRRDPQPTLFIRRRVPIAQLQPTLAECLPAVFGHCMASGIAFAGPPFTRYVEMGPGMVTIECGMPVVDAEAPVTGDIQRGTLPGGDLAVAVHHGAYDRLGETHGALEQWIDAQGLRSAGGLWETYLTDPGEHPDPADWRTEVCWPVSEGPRQGAGT